MGLFFPIELLESQMGIFTSGESRVSCRAIKKDNEVIATSGKLSK